MLFEKILNLKGILKLFVSSDHTCVMARAIES